MLLDATSRGPRLRWIIGAFILIGFAVYGWSVLTNDFVKFDDDGLITENPAVESVSPSAIWWDFTHFDPELYIPLTFVSYQANHLIAGMSPGMFHATNLVLHIINAVLVLLLITKLTGDRRVALLGGLLMLLHPLHTEAVSWASARKDVLSTFFMLASILAYMKSQNSGSTKWYGASVFLFLLGLLSKVSILLMPVILLLTDWVHGRRIDVKKCLPHAILSLFFGVVAVVGKENVLGSSSLTTGILLAAKSTVFYLGKIVIPYPLSVIYPYREEINLMSSDFLIPLLIIAILIAAVLYSLKYTKWIAFGAGIFAVMLLPSFTNYAKGGEIFFASDRYAYVPSIGVFLLVAMAALHVRDRWPSMRKVTEASIVVVLIALGVLSVRQSLVWASTDTLFTNVLEHYNDSPLALNKVGANRIKQGDLDEASRLLEKSIKLSPTARAYYNLGLIYILRQEFDEAERANIRAVKIDPNHAWAHANLGYLYARKKDYQKATTEYETSLALEPTDTETMINLASMYMALGRGADALRIATLAAKTDPGNADVQTLLNALQE